jgi:hypothetical protein
MTEFATVLAGASEWRYDFSRVKFIEWQMDKEYRVKINTEFPVKSVHRSTYITHGRRHRSVSATSFL